jgi:hypothetical protein
MLHEQTSTQGTTSQAWLETALRTRSPAEAGDSPHYVPAQALW